MENKPEYGRSPLIDYMIVINNQKLAEQAKVNLNKGMQKHYPIKMNQTVHRIFPVGEKIEWLPLCNNQIQLLSEIDEYTNSICKAFNVPASLLNTGEHSKTFKP